ncbi:MAG: DNA internalization-related competence protein ComEC/Rec2 [Lachnospiraceae bacterium]|nr:DNA internalization-related competence protein ComEC/Rec2 [Lachnospiraceae bacterium]
MGKRPLVWVFSAFVLGILLWHALGGELHFGVTQHLRSGFARWEAENKESTVSGLIIQTKEESDYCQLRLHHCVLHTGSTNLSIPDILIYQKEKIIYRQGDFIEGTGVLKLPEKPRNDGGYDEEAYYFGEGLLGKFYDAEVHKKACVGLMRIEAGFYRGFGFVREKASAMYGKVLASEEAELLAAVCLGKKDGISEDVKENFQNAGISHVLAISGTHISVVGILLLNLFGKSGISLKIRAGLSFLAVGLFAFGTGGTPSAIRAMLMFGVYLLSIVLGKSYDGLSTMAFVGIIQLLWEPYRLFSTAFQYSYTAVFAVFLALEWIRIKFKKIHPLLSALIISSFVFCLTYPLTVWHQGQIPTYGILFNPLALLFVSPLLTLGLSGTLLGGCFLKPFGYGLIWLAGKLGTGLIGLAKVYGWLFGSVLFTGRPTVVSLIGYGIVMVILLYFAFAKKNFLYMWCGIALAIIIALVPFPSQNQVCMLDVGQGDGVYLETKEGITCFVDGGSSSKKKVGKNTILPFLRYHKKKKVDVWFVSHLDEDHISGLLEVLQSGYPVTRVCCFEGIRQDDRLADFAEAIRQAGSQMVLVPAGKCFYLGGLSIVTFGMEGEEPNAASLGLLVRYPQQKTAFWLGGDMPTEVEEELAPFIRKKRKAGDLLYMKANHHGSNGSNSEAILQALRPRTVLISCGKNNRYGHPGKEALERILKAGSSYGVTTKTGQITIKMENGRIIEKNNLMYDTKNSCK